MTRKVNKFPQKKAPALIDEMRRDWANILEAKLSTDEIVERLGKAIEFPTLTAFTVRDYAKNLGLQWPRTKAPAIKGVGGTPRQQIQRLAGFVARLYEVTGNKKPDGLVEMLGEAPAGPLFDPPRK